MHAQTRGEQVSITEQSKGTPVPGSRHSANKTRLPISALDFTSLIIYEPLEVLILAK